MQKPQSKTQIMIDELFDDVLLAKGFFQNSTESSEELGPAIHPPSSILTCQILKNVEFTLCLTDTSAPDEKSIV